MTKTVLIVEDDELNRKLFNDILTFEGYETRTAADASAALAAAREHRPDLILMDIELPEGSGLDVAGALKRDSALADVPVVVVTAHAMQGDEDRIRARGCAAYVSKPICMKGFIDVVRQFAHS